MSNWIHCDGPGCKNMTIHGGELPDGWIRTIKTATTADGEEFVLVVDFCSHAHAAGWNFAMEDQEALP